MSPTAIATSVQPPCFFIRIGNDKGRSPQQSKTPSYGGSNSVSTRHIAQSSSQNYGYFVGGCGWKSSGDCDRALLAIAFFITTYPTSHNSLRRRLAGANPRVDPS